MIQMRAELQTPGTPKQKVKHNSRVVYLRGVKVGMGTETPGMCLMRGYLVGVEICGGVGGGRKGGREG